MAVYVCHNLSDSYVVLSTLNVELPRCGVRTRSIKRNCQTLLHQSLAFKNDDNQQKGHLFMCYLNSVLVEKSIFSQRKTRCQSV